MIGYCGLDCEQCEAHLATIRDDDALRAKVAEKWAKLNNAPILPEHINCTGCQSAGVKTVYCDHLCEIRKCAVAKQIGTCAECAEYGCPSLAKIFQSAPQAKATLDGLKGK